MAERAVLIPFPLANSAEFVLATKGGLTIPETKITYKKVKSQYKKITSEMKAFEPDALLNKGDKRYDQVWDELTEQQALTKTMLDQARTNYQDAQKPGWNIASTRIACSDDGHLNAMLRLLKNADDVLYIRGHCGSGSSYLESSDHTVRVQAGDVVDLLDGPVPHTFEGAIKLIGCKSACDTIFKQSFARRFAEALAERGFVKARVFGYTASIHTFKDASGHKTTKSGERASDTRVEIQRHRVRSSKCCVQ